MPRNRSEQLPNRVEVLAYATACEAWLADPSINFGWSWGHIPIELRAEIRAATGGMQPNNPAERRRSRLAYIRKAYGKD